MTTTKSVFSEQEEKELIAKILDSRNDDNWTRTECLLLQYRMMLLSRRGTVFPYFYSLSHLFSLTTEIIEKDDMFWRSSSFFREDFWGLNIYTEDDPNAELEIIFELDPITWERGELWQSKKIIWLGAGSAFRWGINEALANKLEQHDGGQEMRDKLSRLIDSQSGLDQPSYSN